MLGGRFPFSRNYLLFLEYLGKFYYWLHSPKKGISSEVTYNEYDACGSGHLILQWDLGTDNSSPSSCWSVIQRGEVACLLSPNKLMADLGGFSPTLLSCYSWEISKHGSQRLWVPLVSVGQPSPTSLSGAQQAERLYPRFQKILHAHFSLQNMALQLFLSAWKAQEILRRWTP